MNRYQAHVTDEWQRDTMVVQVRQMAHNGTTQAVAYVAEDTDGMATVMWHQIDLDQDGREHLVPTLGVRIPHDVAVAMARAILTEAGKDADEVERLKGQVEDLTANLQASAANERALATKSMGLEREVEMLNILVEAKDAHLEREARTGDHFHEMLEHARRDERHEQARRHHPSHTVNPEAMEGVAKAARSISDVFRGVTVSRSDLGLD